MLRPMPASEAREAWGWIRNGLLEVIARCRAIWTPEDVYVAIAAGHAHIYEIENEGDALGFCVLKKLADFDGATLFVWALWGDPGSMQQRSAEIFRQLDMLAQHIGAKRIRMESPRKGWVRYMDAVATVYEREV